MRIHHLLLTIVTVFTLMGLANENGQTQTLSPEEIAYLTEKREIVFIGQTYYPPFEFVDHHDEYNGMTIELIRWIATDMGLQVTFQNRSFRDAQLAVQNEEADVLTGFFYSEERDKKFDFTQTLFKIPASIFVAKADTSIRGMEDLANKTIAMQKGDYAHEFLARHQIHCEVHYTDNFEEATNLVLSGKADAVIGDEQIVYYDIIRNNLYGLVKKVGQPLYEGELCMAVKEHNAVLIGILQKGIERARTTDTLKKIENKWLQTSASSSSNRYYRFAPYFAAGFFFLIFISLIVWYWNFNLRHEIATQTEELKRFNRSLQESKERYRLLVENQSDLLIKVDLEYRFLFVSPSYCATFGKNEEELSGQPFFLIVAPEDQAATSRAFSGVKQAPYFSMVEHRAHTRHGWRWISWSNSGVLDNQRQVTAIVAVGRDITRQKEVEERLQASEERYRLIFNNAPLGILQYDLNGVVKECNDEFTKIMGSSRQAIIHFPMMEKIVNLDFLAAVKHSMQGRTSEYEGEYESVTGKKVTSIKAIFSPVMSESQQIIGGIGMIEDVTVRKKSQEALRASEERYAFSLEATNDGLWDWNLITGAGYGNARYYTMYGYEPNEYEASYENWEARLHRHDINSCVTALSQYFSGRTRTFEAEFRFRCKDGTYKWALGRGKVFQYTPAGEPIRMVGTHVDITDRKIAEAALSDEKERLAVTLRSIADGVITTDTKGQITLLNNAAEDLTGWHQNEVIGRQITDILNLIDEKTGQSINLVNQISNLSGYSTKAATSFLIAKHGIEYVVEHNVVTLFQSNGEKIGMVMAFRDITTTRHLELAKTNFLNAISHELRTPLTLIIGYAELLNDQDQIPEMMKSYLVHILNAAERERKLVEDLLQIARLENTVIPFEFAEIDVVKLFEQIVSETTVLIQKTVKDRYHFDTTNYIYKTYLDPLLAETRLRGNAQMIQQIIENLLLNAVKYSPPDRLNISLTIRCAPDSVIIRVSDQGVGIPVQEFENIFLPFYQIRKGNLDASDGIGHGLSIVKKYVQSLEGCVNVSSELNKGSHFTITLPRLK